jgi:hypothetical protein
MFNALGTAGAGAPRPVPAKAASAKAAQGDDERPPQIVRCLRKNGGSRPPSRVIKD